MKKQIYGSNHEFKAYPLIWLPLSIDDIAAYLNFFSSSTFKIDGKFSGQDLGKKEAKLA